MAVKNNPRPARQKVLLIEDNPADAELVDVMLESLDSPERYDLTHVTDLHAAVRLLNENAYDIILLDLRLPDADGVDAVRSVLKIVGDVPVLVLTGVEDESLAMACIDAGAQDYLNKGELAPLPLMRAIRYSIRRVRESHDREMRETLVQYRGLSSEGAATSITAEMAGVGAANRRLPAEFTHLIGFYAELLHTYVEQLHYKKEKPTAEMERLVTDVGNLGCGPRDLLDLHISALERVLDGATQERARAFVVEGRLLALELMGFLVDYYRTGRRRLRNGG